MISKSVTFFLVSKSVTLFLRSKSVTLLTFPGSPGFSRYKGLEHPESPNLNSVAFEANLRQPGAQVGLMLKAEGLAVLGVRGLY